MLVLIDGNSILNRAFYGIMGNKMLTTPDGKYTNAVYGFLAIMFKVMEDLNPEYMAVAFDLKAPTARHKLYDGYKATKSCSFIILSINLFLFSSSISTPHPKL